MKTHQLIILAALSCLLMFSAACGKKAIRSVSGGEESDATHEVAGHTNDEDFFDDPFAQLDEASSAEDASAEDALGEDVKAVEALSSEELDAASAEDALGGDVKTVDALSPEELDADEGESLLASAGEHDASSMFSASTGSGILDSSEGALGMEHSRNLSQGLTGGQIATSGRPSSGDSLVPGNAQRKGLPVSQNLRDVFFSYDSWQLSEQSHRTLESNAKWIKAHPHARVTIEGHCDERGTQAYNYVLGERRARTIKQYLLHLGIPSYQMTVVSFGKDRPVCHVFSAACFQSNRRAHFSIDLNAASLA